MVIEMDEIEKQVKIAVKEIFETWQREIDKRYPLDKIDKAGLKERLEFDNAIEWKVLEALGEVAPTDY